MSGKKPIAAGPAETPESGSRGHSSIDLIVVGTSMGGLRALQILLTKFPADFPVPLAVVQHRAKSSDDALSSFLQKWTRLRIHDAQDGELIKPGHVYLAPADYHLLVERGRLTLSIEDPVQYSRPSIDVLFESAAEAYKSRLIGVVLTGANADGASGARKIKSRGGIVVVQDPETAEARAMPEAAIATAKVDRIMPISKIATFLITRCSAEVAG